jgi:hypothetical protein
VGLEDDRPLEVEHDLGDVGLGEAVSLRDLVQRGALEPAVHGADADRHQLRGDARLADGALGRDRDAPAHPEHGDPGRLDGEGQVVRVHEHVAAPEATGVDDDRGAVARRGAVQASVQGTDLADPGELVAGEEADGATRLDGAALDSPEEESVPVALEDVLDRKPQRMAPLRLDGEDVERLEDGRSFVPRGPIAPVEDVVAVASGDGDGGEGRRSDRSEQDLGLAGEGAVALLVEVAEVHLVHGHEDSLDADEAEQEGMTEGLLLEPQGRVDDEDGRVGAGGAGEHVLQELRVARSVDDLVGSGLGHEGRPRRVDRDVPLTFLTQGVDGEREVDRAVLLAPEVGPGGGAERARVEEDPADEGGLAVVDVTDEGHAQGDGVVGRGDHVRLLTCSPGRGASASCRALPCPARGRSVRTRPCSRARRRWRRWCGPPTAWAS